MPTLQDYANKPVTLGEYAVTPIVDISTLADYAVTPTKLSSLTEPIRTRVATEPAATTLTTAAQFARPLLDSFNESSIKPWAYKADRTPEQQARISEILANAPLIAAREIEEDKQKFKAAPTIRSLPGEIAVGIARAPFSATGAIAGTIQALIDRQVAVWDAILPGDMKPYEKYRLGEQYARAAKQITGSRALRRSTDIESLFTVRGVAAALPETLATMGGALLAGPAGAGVIMGIIDTGFDYTDRLDTLMQRGLDLDTARKEASWEALAYLPASVALEHIGMGWLRRPLKGKSAWRVVNLAKGFISGAATEAPQEVLQGNAQDLIKYTVSGSQDDLQDFGRHMLENAFLGGLAGGTVRGTFSFVEPPAIKGAEWLRGPDDLGWKAALKSRPEDLPPESRARVEAAKAAFEAGTSQVTPDEVFLVENARQAILDKAAREVGLSSEAYAEKTKELRALREQLATPEAPVPTEVIDALKAELEGPIPAKPPVSTPISNQTMLRVTQATDFRGLVVDLANDILDHMAPDKRQLLDVELGSKDDAAAREKFAVMVTSFLETGLSPRPETQKVFDDFATFLRGTKNRIDGESSPIVASPVFNEMMNKVFDFETNEELVARLNVDLSRHITSPEQQTRSLSKTFELLTTWINTVSFALRNEPRGQARWRPVWWSGRISDLAALVPFEVEQSMTPFVVSKAIRKFTKKDKLVLRAALEANERGDTKTFGELTKDPRIAEAVMRTRQAYDFIWDKYQKHLIKVIVHSQPKASSDAFLQVIDGSPTSKEITARIVSIAETNPELGETLARWILKYQGRKNYFTKAHIGFMRLVTEDGATVAAGPDEKTVVDRALYWLEQERLKNPDKPLPMLHFDNSFADSADPPVTALEQKAYFSLVGRIAKETDASFDTIQKELGKAGIRLELTRPRTPGQLRRRFDLVYATENPIASLKQYAQVMFKKMAVDELAMEMAPELKHYSPRARALLKDQFDSVNPRYGKTDKFVDELLRVIPGLGPFNIHPMAATRAIHFLTAQEASLKILVRGVSSIVNLYSGHMHIIDAAGRGGLLGSGVVYWAKALRWAHTAEGKRFLAEEQAYVPRLFLGDLAVGYRTNMPLIAKLFPWYQLAEKNIRNVALATNYLWAKAYPKEAFPDVDPKYVGEASYREFARANMRFQAFVYDNASIGKLWRHPLMKLPGQFKQYPLQEAQFIYLLLDDPRALASHVGLMALSGGPKAILATFAWMFNMIGISALDDLNEWFNIHYPRISRGIPGLLGVDVSMAFALNLSTNVRDLGGAVISDGLMLIDRVVKPYMQAAYEAARSKAGGGKFRAVKPPLSSQDWLEVAQKLSPMGYHWGQFVQLFGKLDTESMQFGQDAYIRGYKGEPLVRPEVLDLLRLLLAAEPVRSASARDTKAFIVRELKRSNVNRRSLADQIILLLEKGKDYSDRVEDGHRLGLSSGDLEAARERRNIPVIDRMRMDSSMRDLIRMFPYGLPTTEVEE